MSHIEIYQSVLKKLSTLPIEDLEQVDSFLNQLSHERPMEEENKSLDLKSKEEIETNRKATLEFAGAWSDFSDEDFESYLKHTKETGNELFNREIDL